MSDYIDNMLETDERILEKMKEKYGEDVVIMTGHTGQDRKLLISLNNYINTNLEGAYYGNKK